VLAEISLVTATNSARPGDQYQGRTPNSVGLDQINITLPQNVPRGRQVPIIVPEEVI
jgi:uncharacterized protein (TIGR03437 family)